jgi:hypothetical protein
MTPEHLSLCGERSRDVSGALVRDLKKILRSAKE